MAFRCMLTAEREAGWYESLADGRDELSGEARICVILWARGFLLLSRRGNVEVVG